jgi:hypothetical protein
MTASVFTRARIARLCEHALRRSGALGVLPTPLDAVLDAAGVRDRVELARIPARPAIAERLLGAVWFEERALFVDRRQSEPRRRFTEAHEAVHLLCPWHAATLRLDTAAELFGPLVEGIEAEANFGAGQLIFQGDAFHAEALACERSLRTPFALAQRFGASRHAAAHHYVEAHPEPVALIVASGASRHACPAAGWPPWTGRTPRSPARSTRRAARRSRPPRRCGWPIAANACTSCERRSSTTAIATWSSSPREGVWPPRREAPGRRSPIRPRPRLR